MSLEAIPDNSEAPIRHGPLVPELEVDAKAKGEELTVSDIKCLHCKERFKVGDSVRANDEEDFHKNSANTMIHNDCFPKYRASDKENLYDELKQYSFTRKVTYIYRLDAGTTHTFFSLSEQELERNKSVEFKALEEEKRGFENDAKDLSNTKICL